MIGRFFDSLDKSGCMAMPKCLRGPICDAKVITANCEQTTLFYKCLIVVSASGSDTS